MKASKIKRDDKMEAPGKVNEKEQPLAWGTMIYSVWTVSFFTLPNSLLFQSIFLKAARVKFFVNHPTTHLPCLKVFSGFLKIIQDLISYCQSIQWYSESMDQSLSDLLWLS